ncbi:replication protein [Leclercia tamurae]|uniref:replication protein n=1 Tax=Leclercia tamurae TaxID=2926467 RepID=UPI0036F47F64
MRGHYGKCMYKTPGERGIAMSNVAYADFAARSAVRSNRMENQKTGFIPLYRSVLKKPWAKDVFLRTLWENLLLGAARQPYTANFKGRQWPLQTKRSKNFSLAILKPQTEFIPPPVNHGERLTT